MSYLDTIYRAYLDYRKNTASDHDCVQQRNPIAKADAENDCVEVTRVVCKIEEDWLDAIESGLEYVERALAEERQFIRADGEIVPIEKVKRVSRDSVEHLSRHSNLITKESKGDNLIPEQIYTVERLNDYAVYENRFLYMLLCYLEEFIGMRYTRILDLTNTYEGSVTFDKTVNTRQKNITFKLFLDEKLRDDPIMQEINPCKDILERMSMLLKTVNHYKSTPLMEEVSKAARLKPPITKTNVLKMDKNFKGAVALYEFISSYDRDGYTIEIVKKKMRFSEYVSDEYAELYAITSYLTYQYGMGIRDLLKTRYEDEEARRKALAEQQHLEQLRKLRKRIMESGESPEEYMLLLEKQLRVFEGIYTKLEEALAEVDRLNNENAELKAEIVERDEKIDGLNAEIARLEKKYIDDMAALKAEHEAEIDEMQARHGEELEAMRDKYEGEIEELNANCKAQIEYVIEQHRGLLDEQRDKYEREITDIESAHRETIDKLNTEHKEQLDGKAAEIAALNVRHDEMQASFARLDKKYSDMHEEEVKKHAEEIEKKDKTINDIKEENRLLNDLKTLSDGRLNALRHQHGLMTSADDFTSEKAFNELEHQYDVFRSFFKGEWKKTKKKIRDELMRAYRVAGGDHSDGKKEQDAPPKNEETGNKEQEDIKGEAKEEKAVGNDRIDDEIGVASKAREQESTPEKPSGAETLKENAEAQPSGGAVGEESAQPEPKDDDKTEDNE
ncbi:MAG: hypothetical protein J1G01_07410 [Clostridiales bacterium]|nr:hypothetical protein [Clostridiales bacterium]